MPLGSLLAVLLCADPGAASDAGADAAALAKAVFNLGEDAWRGELRPDELLYRCAEASACSGACRQTLNWIADGHDYEHRGELCAELKPRDQKDDASARGAAWVAAVRTQRGGVHGPFVLPRELLRAEPRDDLHHPPAGPKIEKPPFPAQSAEFGQ